MSQENLDFLCAVAAASDGRIPFPGSPDDQQRAKALIAAGCLVLIRRSMLEAGEDYIQITVKGRDEVAEYRRSCAERLEQAVKEAEREEDRRVAQDRSDELARKDARRSWLQFWLRALIDIAIFFLGVYLGGATSTFQWFISVFH